jgi:zinc/manganese transport system permease protein
MHMTDFFLVPFAEPASRQALVAMFAIALGAGPAGIFLMLRRMSLMGDTMSHAILPGIAVAVAIAGLDMFAMTLGGIAAGLVVALLAGLVARHTELKEDASLAAFFLISLALGVVILSATGRDEEIIHFLFGNVTSLDGPRLILIAAIASVSIVGFALIWRALVLECVDPGFLRTVSRAGAPVHYAFMALVVLNLVAAFQAVGTLLAVGLMMLPAVSARFWARDITKMVAVAVVSGMVTGYFGLLVSIHAGVAAGPAIILVAGAIYVASVLFGPAGGVIWRMWRARHLEA